MMNFLSSAVLLKVFLPLHLQEAGTVNEIEMIELSSWEWYLLLSIVILVIWLLILYQTKSSGSHELNMEAHIIGEEASQHHATNHFTE